MTDPTSARERRPKFSDAELVDAYLYVLGRYLVIRQEHIDLSEPGVDYNVLKHSPPVISGAAAGSAPSFVNPNLDVVYSEAWIAVDEDTPAILEIPAIPGHRYFTAQIVDEWAEILHNVNERNFPEHPHGRFALCLRGSNPAIPEDCVRLDLPTAKAKLLARVEIGDDVDGAVALQHGIALGSTGHPSITPAVPVPEFSNQELPGGWVFDRDTLTAALAAPDQSSGAPDVLPAVEKIATFAAAGPVERAKVDADVHRLAIPGFWKQLAGFSTSVNGWGSTGFRPNFGADWRFRTLANFAGIWWNSGDEVIYYLLTPDASGNWPAGQGTYRLSFAGQDLPERHADAFWSLTMYSHPDLKLVPNPLGRYSYGPSVPLERDADGGFGILLSPSSDDSAQNWLPTPSEGEFTLVLRLYLPTADVRDGSWTPPPMQKIEN